MKKIRAIAAFLVLVSTVPAMAADLCSVPDNFGLSDNDSARLFDLDLSRTRGLGGAIRSDNAEERGVVASIFADGLTRVDPKLLPGKYKCRTIKMGGNLPLVVYGWFKCEIVPEEAVFTIRKITGSQNFFGILQKAGAGYVYKGAQHYGYEDQVRFYGDDAERDQVGCLSAVSRGQKHFALELPFPRVESHHDVIEFVAE